MKKIEIFLLIAAICLMAACSESDDSTENPGDNDTANPGDQDLESVEGEDGDGDAEQSEAEEEGMVIDINDNPTHRLVYEIHGPTSKDRRTPYNRLPFPYNYFTVADSQSQTGLKLNLLLKPHKYAPIINTNLIDYGLFKISSKDTYVYAKTANTFDGFSPVGFIMFELEPDLDTASLPQSAEASVSDESPIWIIDLTAGDNFGRRVAFWAKKLEAVDISTEPDTHLFWYLGIRTYEPLKEKTRYAVVVRRGLKAPDGTELQASPHFLFVSGQAQAKSLPEPESTYLLAERERLAPVLDSLEAASKPILRDELLLLFDFTTQSIRNGLTSIQRRYQAGDLAAPAPDFDVDDDGQPDLFTDGSYPTDKFPSFRSIDWTDLQGVLHGTFTATEFRRHKAEGDTNYDKDFDMSFVYDAGGEPVPQGEIQVPFLLFLPKETDEHKEPFPVVIAQHGIQSRKEDMVGFAPRFAALGYATIMMDFPYHNERAVADGTSDAMAGWSFLDVNAPAKAGSSFAQSVSDHIQLIEMIRHWSLDLDGNGASDLSHEKIGYLGHSLGAIVGATTSGVSNTLAASVINVGGGGMLDFIVEYLVKNGLSGAFPDHVMKQLATAAQIAFDRSDSMNFAEFLYNPPSDVTLQKSLLLQECIDDNTVPNSVSENLARAARLPHVKPVEREVPGLTATDGPYEQFGFYQFTDANHTSVMDGGATGEREREQLLHFIETAFTDGKGEIIVPPKP